MEIKNIYLDLEGNVSLEGGVALATLEDLKDWACACGEIFDGFIRLQNGIYYGQDLQEEGVEYSLIAESTPKLYKHFMDSIDKVLEGVVSLKLTDTMLHAITEQRSSSYYHIATLWFDENEEIQECVSMIPKDMVKIA